jgi:Transposase DDE domain
MRSLGWTESRVNAHLAAWFVRQVRETRSAHEADAGAVQFGEHLAIDGKALKGTGAQMYGGEDPQQHLLHVYEVQTGIVLVQCPIGEKRNEVSALKPLLTEVLCKGRILTVDAAQSYHEFGRLVKRAGGDVIVIVKENTPATRADLELFFEDPQADRSTWHSSEQIEKGHGRLERRHILTSPDRNRVSRPRLGRGGASLSGATGTDLQRATQRGSGLWLDDSFPAVLLCRTPSRFEPCALGRGESAPLAARCHPRRGSLWRASGSGGDHVGRSQHRGAFPDGFAPHLQRGQSAASLLGSPS